MDLAMSMNPQVARQLEHDEAGMPEFYFENGYGHYYNHHYGAYYNNDYDYHYKSDQYYRVKEQEENPNYYYSIEEEFDMDDGDGQDGYGDDEMWHDDWDQHYYQYISATFLTVSAVTTLTVTSLFTL